MTSKVAEYEASAQANLEQAGTRLNGGLVQMQQSSRRVLLLYVGAWASLYDAAAGLVMAARRLVESAEQRGERLEKRAAKQIHALEEKTVGQLRDFKDGMHLDEARTSLEHSLAQTQGDLSDRIQAILDGMDIPSREQLERLNREIDLLNEKIDAELQRRAVHA